MKRSWLSILIVSFLVASFGSSPGFAASSESNSRAKSGFCKKLTSSLKAGVGVAVAGAMVCTGAVCFYSNPISAQTPDYIEGKSLRVSVIGDSLASDFHLDTMTSNIWQIRTHQNKNAVLNPDALTSSSLFKKLAAETSVKVTNFATPMAAVFDEPQPLTANQRYIFGIRSFSEQIDDVISQKPAPQITLIWIGHNNLDWVKGLNEAQRKSPEVTFKMIEETFIRHYREELVRLANHLPKSSKSAVVIFGLTQFEEFFKARDEAQELHGKDSKKYPFFETVYNSFESLKPGSYRDGIKTLQIRINSRLQNLVEEMNGNTPDSPNSPIKFFYAEALTQLGGAKDLNDLDAWHPSKEGQQRIANDFYNGIKPARDFIFNNSN
ncbi:MAG: hypothetical protein J0L93_09820 [Deltaproteobacteria bacterium]|nr:hypothetical protein [Deltaproteobacteria bacterium]